MRFRAVFGGALAVVGMGACAAGEPVTAQTSQAFGTSSFALAPVVVPNNGHMDDPNGFAVYWRFDYTDPSIMNDVPVFAVSGETGARPAVVSCGSSFGDHDGCARVGDLLTRGFCWCEVRGDNGESLSPGKNYTYTITLPSKGGNFTNTVRTRQADISAGFSFAVYADTHGMNKTYEERTSASILTDADQPAFAVMAGDLGEVGGKWWGSHGWSRQAMQYDASTGMRARLPVFMAVGNHDWWGEGDFVESGGGWPVMLNMQAGDTQTLYTLAGREGYGGITNTAPGHEYRYYSFDWGNSHFIVLDSGLHSHMEIGGTGADVYMYSADPDVDQYHWLISDLNAVAARPEIKHRFVFLHAPPYSPKGNMIGLVRWKQSMFPEIFQDYFRAPDGPPHIVESPLYAGEKGRIVLEDILRQFGVDAVFAGHDHFYAHLAYGGIQYFICSAAGHPEFDDKATHNHSQATFIEGDGFHGGYCTVTVTGEAYTVKRKRTTKVDGTASSPPDLMFQPWTNGGALAPTNPDVKIQSNNPGIDKTAKLTWIDHSATESQFEVQRSVASGTPGDASWISWATLPANTQAYVDDNGGNGLVPATRYWYRVRAVYGTGSNTQYSDWTKPVSLVFGECKQSTPQGAFDGTQVILSWTPFTCSGAQPVSRYRIERRIDAGNPWHLLKKTNGAETLAVDTALSCQPSYDYRIIAELVNGHTSQESDPVYVPIQIPDCGVSVSYPVPVTPTTIGVHWLNDGKADKWITVQRSVDGVSWTDVATYAPGATQPSVHVDKVTSSCTSSTKYYYRVGASATSTGPRAYGPVTEPIAPTMCLYPPTVSAAGGAGKITLAITPNKALPTLPDTWAIQRRVKGSSAWGDSIAISASSSTAYYDDDRECEVEPEVTYEYRVMGMYSGATSGFDTGFGAATDWSNTTSASMTRAESGCADGGANDALINPGLNVSAWGCKGSVKWADRDTLCAPGYSACTASQWNALRGSQVPSAHYWTDDNLQYTGTGSNACGAVLSGGNVCYSAEPRPMRVCAPATSDAMGNTCTWTGCGLGTTTPLGPNAYFGGCSANPTAGTLCCRDASPCADGAIVDAVAPGIGGCPGSVTWEERDTLCAQGCRACSVEEWTHFNKVPTHDYWTDDDLRWSGTGSNACAVSATSGNACPAGQPMRICSARQPDPEGNSCTWTGCGYGTNSPNKYFGGCSGTGANATAGTMCCCGY